VLLLLEVPEFPYNTAGQVEESLHAKASSFYPTQHLLVADRQKRAKRDNKYRAIMVLLKWSVRPQVRAFMVCFARISYNDTIHNNDNFMLRAKHARKAQTT